MRKIIIISFVVFINILIGNSFAQNTKTDNAVPFSLKQAQDYALKNSPVMKYADIDFETAKKRIWEYTAMGLPQVNSKFAYSYMLTLPPLIKEFTAFSSIGDNFKVIYQSLGILGQGNTMVLNKIDSMEKASSGSNVNFGNINDLRWSCTYDITVSQLLFSGSYLVGLQTNKELKNLSEISISKSQNDLTESVNNAYYMVLIAQQNKVLLDSIAANSDDIFNYIKAMNAQGFLEETDVDQMEFTVNTIKNSDDMITRQVEVAKNFFKYQIGYDISKNILLTDNLDALLSGFDYNTLLLKEFNINKYPDYQLMESNEKLQNFYLKYQKSFLLPDVAAFYNHEENFNKQSFTFTPPDMIGLNVNIPIFGSGMKLARIKQAKLNLEKAHTTTQQVSDGLQTSFFETKSSYISAYNTYLTNRKNIETAEKIYKHTLIKYKAGMATSLELSQSQTQYLQSQSNYYTSVIGLTSAKSKLEKMLK